MRQSGVAPSLVAGVDALIAQAETICETDPGMCDAAAMVFVGDVYALREEIQALAAASQTMPRYDCDTIDYAV